MLSPLCGLFFKTKALHVLPTIDLKLALRFPNILRACDDEIVNGFPFRSETCNHFESGGENSTSSKRSIAHRSIFKPRKSSVMNRSSLRNRIFNRAYSSQNLVINHIGRVYDFLWNETNFILENSEDSINYGELVVSPPPSGEWKTKQICFLKV